MSAIRRRKFASVVAALGPAVIGPADPHQGWPGAITVATANGNVAIALHVSAVSTHARHEHEMRFQNPAAKDRPPVSDLGGRALPVLLGLVDDGLPTIFIGVDGKSRLGNINRFSILFDKRIIAEARSSGWSVHESTIGEKFYAFVPGLFPAFVEQIRGGEMLPPGYLVQVTAASGLLETFDREEAKAEAIRRATRAVNVLVRKAGAGRKIRDAYNNRCAMCGLGAGLLAGAHVFPVEAVGSTDEVWNGICLCHNHHAAFDKHLIWINPANKIIKLHQDILDEAIHNAGTQKFVNSTLGILVSPQTKNDQVRQAMFERRYEHFQGKYDWAM